ncbi:MAG: hypothetical protein M4D80_38555 [Myxococcota bacterium]|nr:hypothetical protein [Myxococcota bacterium]
MRGFAICVVAAIGCANNVPQDRKTGPDGLAKGALPIVLENGEGATKGVVTYPGGDRVDWKVVELPSGKKGRLDFQMQWVTPRPGLQLGFDVFDQWNKPVANSRGRGRVAVVGDARGKYYVRVYAKRRGDAGAYKLAVAFTEEIAVKPVDLGEIPEPPRLPAVPGKCEIFDPRDVTCADECPAGGRGAPPNWPACIAQGVQQPPAPPVVVTPPPIVTPPPADPIEARVLIVEIRGGDVVVTLSAGSDQGVAANWTGQLMRGQSKSPYAGGKITIIKVDKQRTLAKVPLTIDIVTANRNVILKP